MNANGVTYTLNKLSLPKAFPASNWTSIGSSLLELASMLMGKPGCHSVHLQEKPTLVFQILDWELYLVIHRVFPLI